MAHDITKKPDIDKLSITTSRFLGKIRDAQQSLLPPKIIFGFDATASREPTWEAAIPMQAELLGLFAKLGETPPQLRLSYFRGSDEFEATNWTSSVQELTQWMRGVNCLTGTTQISRILGDAVTQTELGKIAAVLYVGDCMEESAQDLYRYARRLDEKKVPVYLFQEGNDAAAFQTFAEIARLTGGRHVEFMAGNFLEMQDLAKVVMAQTSGSQKAITAVRNDASLASSAKKLLLSFHKK